ncbi:thioredoxin family protein [Bacillus sp. PS06]|uniref:thioredoxin family protein n=1 Tax=Bacillus sp. PS06 TaxID=2764176 RepID=UPI00178369D3|nr:thioredoxin family protein [Bacillus sp. PS06]MBD8071061.1 thioredoxin family protein [Bacillus sp. PS06]
MKKLIIFTSIIIVLFGALAFVTTYSNSEKVKGNPYGKDTLNQATTDQLDDPNYQNQILPEELKASLEAGETQTVYFYSPTCPACQASTPVVVPLAEELGIDLKKFNLLEFQAGWNEYGIDVTPTIIHFVDGKEVKRIDSYQEEETFRTWFSELEVEK